MGLVDLVKAAVTSPIISGIAGSEIAKHVVGDGSPSTDAAPPAESTHGAHAAPDAASGADATDLSRLSPGSSHLNPKIPERDRGNIERVSVEVTSDQLAGNNGLSFSALQVNFNDGTWAHGGPQQNGRTRSVNWGGLVSAGGGTDDYARASEDPSSITTRIINPQGDAHVKDVDWQDGHRYEMTVEKGPKEIVPAGDYQVTGPSSESGHLDKDTEYQTWTFRVRDLTDGGKTVYEEKLHNHADKINDFSYWTETGYGFGADQHGSVNWTNPAYRTADAPDDVKAPEGLSVGYSDRGDPAHPENGGTTAPDSSTSNTELINADTLETRTTFATQRTNQVGTEFDHDGTHAPGDDKKSSSGSIGAVVGGALGAIADGSTRGSIFDALRDQIQLNAAAIPDMSQPTEEQSRARLLKALAESGLSR